MADGLLVRCGQRKGGGAGLALAVAKRAKTDKREDDMNG